MAFTLKAVYSNVFKLYERLNQREKIENFIFYFLFLLPVLLNVYLQKKMAVSVPFMDDWEMVDLYRLWISEHTLTFQDLWTPHNEHRILFANLLGLAIIHLTNLNTLIAMYLATFVKFLVLIIFYFLLKDLFKNKDQYIFKALCVTISFIIFSIHDGELLTWGIVGLYWNTFLLMQFSLFSLLYFYYDSWGSILLSLFLGIACSLIISNGLPLLILGGLQIGLMNYINGKPFKAKVLLWILLTSVFIYLYFFDYQSVNPESLSSFMRRLIDDPLVIANFFSTYMSSIIIPKSGLLAIFICFLSIIAYVLMLIYCWRYHRSETSKLIPWLFIALNVLIGSILTTYGRIHMGLESATASRYTALSKFYWISFFVLFVITFYLYCHEKFEFNKVRKVSILVLALFCFVPILITNTIAFRILIHHWLRFSVGLYYLKDYRKADDAALKLLYPVPERILSLTEFLDKNNVGPFSLKNRKSKTPNQK
jgi:hypothetical protein